MTNVAKYKKIVDVDFQEKSDLLLYGSKYVTNDRYKRYGRYSRGKEHFSKYSLYFKKAKYCIEHFCKLRDIKIVPNSFSQSEHGSVYCDFIDTESDSIATIRVSDHYHPNPIYVNENDIDFYSLDGFFLTTKNFVFQ
jgi:hypothetical protein